MDIYDKKIDNLIKNMDDLNISDADKIKYLKLYSKILKEKQSEIENNFIIGTFISSLGLGTMLDISNIYLSILLFGTGIAISLYKAKEFDNDITLKDLNEYKRSR
ncbi:MAG: hypothetical protein E7157_01245 [Lactobacillales bacterium]|nr:hypothetical protein [Lactobacillales bacterium]